MKPTAVDLEEMRKVYRGWRNASVRFGVIAVALLLWRMWSHNDVSTYGLFISLFMTTVSGFNAQIQQVRYELHCRISKLEESAQEKRTFVR